ncbi:MAG TPA: hypothetical protein VF855_08750 [Acidimicrobiales bacterium]
MSSTVAHPRLAHWRHLAGRFFSSLSRHQPDITDEAWARMHLLPGEQAVWRRMSAPDRRHAIGVAQRTVHALGTSASRPVVAAALLHDCGKVEARMGTFARVGATLWAGVIGRERAVQGRGRVARYLRHDLAGELLLQAAGSDPLTVAWAGEHHRPRSEWTVPQPVADALKAADDD